MRVIPVLVAVFPNEATALVRAFTFLAGVAVGGMVLGGAGAQGLDWTGSDGVRSAPLSFSAGGRAGFVRLAAAEAGVGFTNQLAESRYITNQIYLNGAGVALGDVDGDGWCDVYLCGIDNQNELYRNLGGWKFERITESAGVGCVGLGGCSGAVLADLDGDGDLDLIVNTVASGTHLFLNDGKARFTEPAPAAPLNPDGAGMSLALADIDGDGDLDLYVANYRRDTIRDHPEWQLKGNMVNGRPVVISVDGRPATERDLVGRFTLLENGRILENGLPDALFLNEGDGRFTPVSFIQGAFRDEQGRPLADPPYDWGLSVMFRDLNGDGAPDLYVCNDFDAPDRIWLNDGTGRFRAIDPLTLRHTSLFSMGVDVGDLNRDGLDDVFVSDMLMAHNASRQLRVGDVMPVFLPIGAIDNRPQYLANTLQLNRGDGTYAEVAWYGHAEASGWTWCPVLIDVDLDGYEDLIFPTGHERDMMNGDVINQAEVLRSQKQMSRMDLLRLRTLFQRFDTPNVALRNRGDLTFEDRSEAWGFTAREVSQGIALADLDNDGDLDVVVNNLNGGVGLYRNDCPAPRVAVRLKGRAPNTHGIGAKVWLYGGAVPQQSQEILSGGRYLSSDEAMRVFAAGNATNGMRLEVAWRSGRRSIVPGIQANRVYEVDEASATGEPVKPAPAPAPFFEEVPGFRHTHHEDDFDDYGRQPLLPWKLSQPGPGVCWHDFDDDGWDDLAIGTGRGGRLALFRNNQQGGFTPVEEPFLSKVAARDQTSVLGMESGLIVGMSNYEDGLTNGGCVRICDFNRKVAGESVTGQLSSTGPLAIADVDGEGSLDLFVGGRGLPGRYPEPADSLLLRNEGGRLVMAQRFAKLGLVQGAVFSDLDGDGDVDLVLSCAWGPIRVFRNDGGNFREVTKDMGLAPYTGWWNGVTTGDLDQDGRPDIIAGNWGLNSVYRASPQHPRKVYFGDLDGDGVVDLIETSYDPALGRDVADRGFRTVSKALPWLSEIVPGFAAYGQKGALELYGDRLKNASVTEVATLASMVFFNRGDHFEAHELPAEAQFAPALGVGVADFDGDGEDDVFLSQNFFAVAPDLARQDAGRGLWLKGDGRGGLKAVPGQESGVRVYGEQRGCALGDFDRDGRVDLAVSQNGAATKLYRNVRGRPGLRVRLAGPAGNRTAVGASVRLKFGDRFGPLREIHAGSGYLSHDSRVVVLGTPEPPTGLEVRWPGGKQMAVRVPADAREITVDLNGRVEKTR
jgi:enediyne biosynthesis protein E4